MSIAQEFKAFVMRGNVVDLAVGVIIGAAFGKIVASLVADVIMPPIGMLMGGVNFTDIKFVMKDAVVEGAKTIPAVTLNIGNFIQTIVDFMVIAAAIFAMVRVITSLQKKREEAPAAPAAPTVSETLLTEIRDTLARQR